VAADAAKPTAAKAAKPAEALIHELYAELSDTQKKSLVLPWDDPARTAFFNSALKGQKLGEVYTKPQQDLISRIFKAILSGEEGYRTISRNNKWDSSGKFENLGAHLFGEPVPGKKYACVFSGHHLTIRCDGDSLENAAFGGPLYYGHSAQGYSDNNVYFYQTKGVLNVFKTLDAKQRDKAIIAGTPGEHAASIKFRKPTDPMPGIAITELNAEQRALVELVMRDILMPYRKEDADEVMKILKANGGLDKIHLAYYRENKANDNERWHFWRLEGPGFVWNYRVLDHVHCYVNIAASAMG
jgi:hypothetical protein